MDEDTRNEVRAESLRDTFYTFLSAKDWDGCRDALKQLEDMRIGTWRLRQNMNRAMGNAKPLEKPLQGSAFSAKKIIDNITWGDSEFNPSR